MFAFEYKALATKQINSLDQVVIAQWLARRLATWKVLGSNPSRGENLLISDKKKGKFN